MILATVEPHADARLNQTACSATSLIQAPFASPECRSAVRGDACVRTGDARPARLAGAARARWHQRATPGCTAAGSTPGGANANGHTATGNPALGTLPAGGIAGTNS